MGDEKEERRPLNRLLLSNPTWGKGDIAYTLGKVKEALDPAIGDFPIEVFDPLTAEQESALSAWFKKLRGALS